MISRSNKADKGCFDYALKLLRIRDYFSGEIRKKLIAKDFAIKDADETLQKLTALKYIDDNRTIEKFAAEVKRKMKGVNYLKRKLYEKGSLKLFPERLINENYTVDDEIKVIKTVAKKLKAKGDELKRRLMTRGFSTESIIRALNGQDE